MDSIWNLNAFLIFTGLCFEVAAAWLLQSVRRVESAVILTRFAMILLWVAIPLQIIGLLVPELAIANYWFVLGASPLLLPAPLLYQARQRRPSVRPAMTVRPVLDEDTRVSETDFEVQLRKIPLLLSKNPKGLTLVEIGDELGVDWRRLTGAANELLQLNRIRKEGKRYFIQSQK